jgi:hypothetical protein
MNETVVGIFGLLLITLGPIVISFILFRQTTHGSGDISLVIWKFFLLLMILMGPGSIIAVGLFFDISSLMVIGLLLYGIPLLLLGLLGRVGMLSKILDIVKLFLPASRSNWVKGGIYAIATKGGSSYQVLKILMIDEGGVHIRLYGKRFADVPSSVDEASLYMAEVDRGSNEEPGMGHLPVSKGTFASWGARFVQQSGVSVEELDGYKIWREDEGGYF